MMETMNDPVVKLTFNEPISDNRFRTENITPEMLEAIAQRIYNNSVVSEMISGWVEEAFERLYPKLIREQDEDGNSRVEVVLSAFNVWTKENRIETIFVWASDLDDAEDLALFYWKKANNWNDDAGTINIETVEWA